MKVFISWSGKRSKETAQILSSWIRQVIQSAETWISSDIDKGARWNEQINRELEQTKIGIICLNKENLSSEWILFEAGALSKTSDAYVCTFLLDVNPADIKPPLGQFQHTSFSKDDVKKLLQTINNKILASNEKGLNDKDFEEVFETFWPKLEKRLNDVRKEAPETKKQHRSDRDILEEILHVVRTNNKTSTPDVYQPILNALGTTTKNDYDDLYNSFIKRNYFMHSSPSEKDFYKKLLLLLTSWKTRESKEEGDSSKQEGSKGE